MTRAWVPAAALALPLLAAGQDQRTGLADAAMRRDTAAVRALLSQRADANAVATLASDLDHFPIAARSARLGM